MGEHILIGLIGGGIYYGLEVLWRGYSHVSMFVLGGVCFAAIGLLDEIFPNTPSLLVQMLMGSALVTTAELLAGLIVNVWLGLGVWDYSHMPMNFMGQICLAYSALWFVLAGLAVKLEDALHLVLDRMEKTAKSLAK